MVEASLKWKLAYGGSVSELESPKSLQLSWCNESHHHPKITFLEHW